MTLKHPESRRARLHILSPVHVGTGQELDPFSYIIRNRTLFLIDLAKWLESHPEPDKLSAMMDSDSFANTRSFIAENFDSEDAVLCAIPLDDWPFLREYQNAVRKKDPRNQVLVSPMTRNPLGTEAFIPGSSIKGAIRTAIANAFVKKTGVSRNDARGRDDYNKKIFGPINKDPMRNLKIGDVPLTGGTVIVESREFPLNPDKSLTPKGHMEAAVSLCHLGKPVVYPLRLSLADFDIHGETINPAFILECLNRFYVEKYVDEYEKFFKSDRAGEIRREIASVNREVARLKTNEALVRIGHFSHVECVTLDGVRNPRTRRGRDGKPLPWGVTRTLANGLYPFGWAKIEITGLDSGPGPGRKWPFPTEIEGSDTGEKQKRLETGPISLKEKGPPGKPVEARPAAPMIELSPLEKLMKRLRVIKNNDMGSLGTIIQAIETLETDADKGALARAVKDKMNPKTFKKYKKKGYLNDLIEKAGVE